MDKTSDKISKGSVLDAFDRLFDRAAAKLHVECTEQEKREARRDFEERSAAALQIIDQLDTPAISDEMIRHMEEAIEQIPAAQLVGYLAAMPLALRAQEMLRHIAFRAAQQKLLDQFIEQADDSYGGN